MKVKTYPFDAADYLTDEETIAEYLTLSLESGDPLEIVQALNTIVRARGGAPKLAGVLGLDEESLSKILSDGSDSGVGATLKVLYALGVRLSAATVA